MLRVFLCSLALLVALPLSAGGPRAVRKQAESSLRVTGFVVIGQDGTVQGHELDPKAALTPVLVEFIGGALDRWRFEPVKVNGEVVRARVPMSLRLVAKRSDDERFQISIASTHFGSGASSRATDSPQRLEMKPPRYPMGALKGGGKGTAYLVVQVGRDGKVMNVDAEQVNLRVAGSANQMDALRKQFAQAAIHAAKSWTFDPPTTGKEAGKTSWLVRVPVDFRLGDEKGMQPGEWETYIPGPRNSNMPWAQEQLKLAGSPDALPDSGVFPLEEGAKLLTPPAT
ncbi:energy transducer TonB [Thermomonas fusca]